MFSEKQIKEIVKTGFVNEDLKVKTIKQSQANYKLDIIELIRNSPNYSNYFKSDTFYTAFEEINGILWLVISGKAITKAESTSNKALSFSLPNEFFERYGDKILKADGKNLLEVSESSSTPNLFLFGDAAQRNLNGSQGTLNILVNCSSVDAKSAWNIGFFGVGTFTDDGFIWLDIRIPIVAI